MQEKEIVQKIQTLYQEYKAGNIPRSWYYSRYLSLKRKLQGIKPHCQRCTILIGSDRMYKKAYKYNGQDLCRSCFFDMLAKDDKKDNVC